jgi:hypothetical protein
MVAVSNLMQGKYIHMVTLVTYSFLAFIEWISIRLQVYSYLAASEKIPRRITVPLFLVGATVYTLYDYSIGGHKLDFYEFYLFLRALSASETQAGFARTSS